MIPLEFSTGSEAIHNSSALYHRRYPEMDNAPVVCLAYCCIDGPYSDISITVATLVSSSTDYQSIIKCSLGRKTQNSLDSCKADVEIHCMILFLTVTFKLK